MRKALGILGLGLLALVAGAAGPVVVSVAVSNVTGLGANVATALGIAVGSAGGPVTNGGALGTPSSGTATNLSGTAASLTAGNVTTNANLTGDVTSVGNAATLPASSRLKSKVITGTRDLTVASGSQAITGMGFQPTACIATGGLGSSFAYTSPFGMVDSALTGVGNIYTLGGATQFNKVAHLMTFNDSTGSNEQYATVASFDADGLTLSWVKTGTPTGTVTFYIMCFR